MDWVLDVPATGVMDVAGQLGVSKYAWRCCGHASLLEQMQPSEAMRLWPGVLLCDCAHVDEAKKKSLQLMREGCVVSVFTCAAEARDWMRAKAVVALGQRAYEQYQAHRRLLRMCAPVLRAH